MKSAIRPFVTRAIALLFAGLFLVMLGCTRRSGMTRYERIYLDAFDTVTQVTLYHTDAAAVEESFQAIHEQLLFYHRLFDIYHSYAGLTNLNDVNRLASKTPLPIDPALMDFLAAAKEAYRITNGRMNIAMGTVLRPWHDARALALSEPSLAALPDFDDLREAARHTDIDALILNEADGTVFFQDEALRLDVGAFAKGYAAERIVTAMRERGLDSLLLSIGGNVCTIGTHPDGTLWQVGIQDPRGEGYLGSVPLLNQSLVTSGSYQRYFTVDDTRYHHIIDPDTCMPANYLTAVTILAESSALADALSTALFNLPYADGRELVSSMEGVEALWVLPDDTVQMTEGFQVIFTPIA